MDFFFVYCNFILQSALTVCIGEKQYVYNGTIIPLPYETEMYDGLPLLDAAILSDIFSYRFDVDGRRICMERRMHTERLSQ